MERIVYAHVHVGVVVDVDVDVEVDFGVVVSIFGLAILASSHV